jgi:hypothetical protein
VIVVFFSPRHDTKQFYKYCQKYKDEVDDNPTRSLYEARNFEKSCPFQDMLDRVTAKLGLDRRLSPRKSRDA